MRKEKRQFSAWKRSKMAAGSNRSLFRATEQRPGVRYRLAMKSTTDETVRPQETGASAWFGVPSIQRRTLNFGSDGEGPLIRRYSVTFCEAAWPNSVLWRGTEASLCRAAKSPDGTRDLFVAEYACPSEADARLPPAEHGPSRRSGCLLCHATLFHL